MDAPPSVRRFALALAALAVTVAGPVAAAELEHRIDPDASRVRIHVGTSGVFGGLGHEHLVEVGGVSGTVRYDPDDVSRSSVAFEAPAARVRVLDPDLDADTRAEVQADMEEKVLESRRHATIRFRSTRVEVRDRSPGTLSLVLHGDLTLHGRTREVSIPAEVDVQHDRLVADGEWTFTHRDFGLRRVSAGLGTVRVAEELVATFRLVAEPVERAEAPAPPQPSRTSGQRSTIAP